MCSVDGFDRNRRRLARKVNDGGLDHARPFDKAQVFKGPPAGRGKYAHLGFENEEFLRLRDRTHIVPVMVEALEFGETEVEALFDRVADRFGRDTISAAEFYDEFRDKSG
jgi:hypothetical protein